MTAETKYPLLREAIAIAMGIPPDRFNLNTVRRNYASWEDNRNPHHCGTVGCVMGWLSLHPKFNKLGLDPGTIDGYSMLRINGVEVHYDFAASKLFGITRREAKFLFGSVSARTERELGAGVSHHKVLVSRVRKFLASKGEACAI